MEKLSGGKNVTVKLACSLVILSEYPGSCTFEFGTFKRRYPCGVASSETQIAQESFSTSIVCLKLSNSIGSRMRSR